MKKRSAILLCCTGILLTASSCGTTYLASFSPEESGLNLMKITDESSSRIGGNGSGSMGSQ